MSWFTVTAIPSFLIIADVLWLLIWVGLTWRDIDNGTGLLDTNDSLLVSQAGFTALAAPHTALIPALLSMRSDLEKACTQEDKCKFPIPALTWFVVPALTIPFDVLFYKYNNKYYDKYVHDNTKWPVPLSAYQLSISCSVCAYAFYTYFYIAWPVWPFSMCWRKQSREIKPVQSLPSAYYRSRFDNDL